MKKKPRIDPLQPFVGTYRLGGINVDLYGQKHDYGGTMFFAPDDTSRPRIKVSFLLDHWWEVVNVLLHESFEFMAAQKGVRFIPCCSFMRASDLYRFDFDHNVMSQIMEDQAYFLAKCLPDLAKAYKKYH